MTQKVVMVSGGVDSFLASALYPDAKLVFVQYGQPYASMEGSAVEALYGRRASRVCLDGIPQLGPEVHVPARNLMLATVGLRYGPEICLAGMRDEQCSDKNPEAFRAMSEILTAHSHAPVTVFSPFWKLMKADAVRQYLASGRPREALLQTVSCYGGKEVPCNDCDACFRRWACLEVNGVRAAVPSLSSMRSYGLRLLHEFPRRKRLAVMAAISSQHPVLTLSLDEHRDLSKLPESGGRGFTVLHTELPESRRHEVRAMLAAEGVRYDALLMDVQKQFFTERWEMDP